MASTKHRERVFKDGWLIRARRPAWHHRGDGEEKAGQFGLLGHNSIQGYAVEQSCKSASSKPCHMQVKCEHRTKDVLHSWFHPLWSVLMNWPPKMWKFGMRELFHMVKNIKIRVIYSA